MRRIGLSFYKFAQLLMRVVAEAAEIVGDSVLVTGRHRGGVAGANLARLILGFATQLQLELVDVVKHLRVKLLDKRGIAGEAARIETLHLLDELIDLLLSLRVILKFAAQRAETVGLLLNDGLKVTRIHSGAGRHGLRQFRIVAGVDIAIVAIATLIAATERSAEATARAVAVVHTAGLIVAASILRVSIALA